MCIHGGLKSQKRASVLLHLELWMIVNNHVGAGVKFISHFQQKQVLLVAKTSLELKITNLK